jgi:hypothetical protein
VHQAEPHGIPDLYGVSAEPCWRCVRYHARARFPGAVGTHQLSGESVRHHTNTEYCIQTLMYIKLPCPAYGHGSAPHLPFPHPGGQLMYIKLPMYDNSSYPRWTWMPGLRPWVRPPHPTSTSWRTLMYIKLPLYDNSYYSRLTWMPGLRPWVRPPPPTSTSWRTLMYIKLPMYNSYYSRWTWTPSLRPWVCRPLPTSTS